MWNVTRLNGEPVDHLSPSSLEKFMNCPEAWRLHYLVGKPRKENVYAAWGKAHHMALGRYFGRRLAEEPTTPEETASFFRESFGTLVREAEGFDWRNLGAQEVAETGSRLVEAYVRTEAWKLQPIMVEERRETEIDGINFVTVVDLVTENDLIDLKTASRVTTKVQPSWFFQGFCYQLVWGKPLTWHVCVKQTPPKIVTGLSIPYVELRQGRTRSWICQLTSQIQNLYDAYGPDNPWPGNGLSNDACWRCDFREGCHWRVGL